MRVLATADLQALVGPDDAFGAVEAAYRQFGRYRALGSTPPSMNLDGPTPASAHHRIKGASAPDLGAAGIRIASYAARGEADRSHYALVLDYETGRPLGFLDEEWLHALRAATQAIVAAKYLARADSRVVGLIGAGRIASHLFPALARRFPIADVRVMAKPSEGAAAFARRHAAAGLPVRAVETAEAAVRGADIVITITTARQPFLEPGWLAPGAFLCSMGGVHEVFAGVLAEADRFVVDDFDYALSRGDMGAWVKAGDYTAADLRARLDADIGEIVAGLKPGRRTDSERVLAIIQGLAVCDLAMAKLAVDRANEAGRGLWVEV
ncbi:MAG: ornithine cyclodeaminase family protein [Proteobacteria bacterium]|nr:ornithine cyclodeaminase family protein [Pseudomonadota bacterium]